MILCEHGKCERFGCLTCLNVNEIIERAKQSQENRRLSRRLDGIEEKVSEKYAHPDVIGRIENLEVNTHNRIALLEEHKARQIDENRKISRRVDQIQAFADSHLSCWNALDDKIKMLECNLLDLQQSVKVHWDDREYFYEEIKILKEFVKEWVDFRCEYVNGKKPHKCPVCDGDPVKEYYEDDGLKRRTSICTPCDGKGIIWV